MRFHHGVEKWKFDLAALFCKVIRDVWCDEEEPRLLFARPECLGLSEHLGSNAGLGFYGKSVLPPVCIDFDYCVGLLVVDSIWFPAYDLRSESCRAQEPLEGCFDQFCVLGFAFHLWANLIRSYFLVVHEARTSLNSERVQQKQMFM